jgi:hypothetical protein
VYYDREMNVFPALVAGAFGVLYGRTQARIASEMKAKHDEQEREVGVLALMRSCYRVSKREC